MRYVFVKKYYHKDIVFEVGWEYEYSIENNTFRIGDFKIYVKDSEIGELLDSSEIRRGD